MTGKHHSTVSYPEFNLNDPDSLDDYYESTRLEARFDPTTIQLLVVEAVKDHKIYGMMFEQYMVERSQYRDYDDTEKKRLSFYLPAFFARVSADLAIINRVSQHTFIIMMIELGLIRFRVDYADEYKIIEEGRPAVFGLLGTEANQNLYMQIEKQTIILNSGMGFRTGGSKHFVPNVYEWLYDAAMNTSTHMNMSISDFVYLCWCIGVQNTLPEDMVPRIVGRRTLEVCDTFRLELQEYSERIDSILKKMRNTPPY